MEIGAVIFTEAVTLKLGSAAEDPVINTKLPTTFGDWSIEGAVKTAIAPLSVCAVSEPQFGLLQVTVQSTPALLVSPATLAATFASPPAGIDGGGGTVKAMPEMLEVIVTVAAELLL
jgi:hypothetical protein